MRIILVENADDRALWMQSVLVDHGHEVEWLADGNTGWQELANASDVDMLIAEAILPGMRGEALIDLLWQSSPEARAIILYPAIHAPAPLPPGCVALDLPFSRQRLIDTVARVASGEVSVAEEAAASLSGGLPEALLELGKIGSSGMLHVRSGDLHRRLTIRGGAPTYVWGDYSSDNFGRFLVRRGVISDAVLEESHALMVRESLPQGEALITLGAFQQTHLFELLRAFHRERMLAMFTWPDPQLEFRAGELAPPGEPVYAVDPIALVFEGYQRHGGSDELFRWPELHGDRYVKRTRRFEQLYPLLQSQWPKLPLGPLSQGADSVDTVLRRVPVDTVFAVRTLRAMLSLEMIELVDGPTSAVPEEISVDDAQIVGEFNLDHGRDDFEVDIDVEVSDECNEIFEIYLSLQFTSYYELLGISADAPPDVITSAEQRVGQHVHSLLKAVQDHPEAPARAQEILLFVQFAASVLCDSEARATYDQQLQEKKQRNLDRRASLGAETRFKSGLQALRDGQPMVARIEFEAARALRQDDALCNLYLSWAAYLELRQHAQRIGTLRQQVADQARLLGDATGHAFHAEICLDLGFEDYARQAAVQALNIDESCADANRVLTRLDETTP